jgi:D-aminoacyl-tRNA deacylase
VRVVLQRVSRAAVRVRGKTVAESGPGLMLLVGAGRDDGPGEAERLAEKVVHLRVFADDEGKMNLSIADVGGEALVVPQFTLYGDWRRGRRPSWVAAGAPDAAAEGVEAFARALERLGIRVGRGAFREHMEVELVNDGPVTMVLDGAQLRSGGR